MKKPVCVFITRYYQKFIEEVYNNKELQNLSYHEQLASLINFKFGDSNFYSSHLAKHGFQTYDIILNAEPLNLAWAKENKCSETGFALIIEMLKQWKPDIIYLQDLHIAPQYIQALREQTPMLVGQIASTGGSEIPFGLFDILISSIHEFVDTFRQHGLKSYYQALAFEPKCLEDIIFLPYHERPIPVSYVGGLEGFSPDFFNMLEELAEKELLQIWGYGIEHIPASSVLHKVYQGEAWGKKMFQALAYSKITLNRHRDFAGNSANNMRLYEATGCQALLLTEQKDNLHELFAIGEEVLAYRSTEECKDLVYFALHHPDQASKIAKQGQIRTLNTHTYEKNMAQTAIWLKRHLRFEKEKPYYKEIADKVISVNDLKKAEQTNTDLESAWKDPSIPEQQRSINIPVFQNMYGNVLSVHLKAIIEALKPIWNDIDSLLDIGCSAGYLAEQISYIFKKEIHYTGVDYSSAFITMATDYYPEHTFTCADGASLPYFEKEFDVAISAGVIVHTPNYYDQLKELCRVAKKYAILHRTPYLHQGATLFLEKKAYDVPCHEIWYNRNEIHTSMKEFGFVCVKDILVESIGNEAFALTELFIREENTMYF